MKIINNDEKINNVLKVFLPTVEQDYSILKGELLKEAEKSFIYDNPNAL